MKREAISKRKRFEVFKRDSFTCQYCGAHPPAVILHLDHVIPVAKGGKNDADNLIAACEACNQGKSDKSLSVVPESLKLRIVEIKEREEQIAGYNEVMTAKRDRIERQSSDVFRVLFGADTTSVPRDWFRGMRGFIERLGLDDAIDAAHISSSRWDGSSDYKKWRYFCGICWRRVRGEANA